MSAPVVARTWRGTVRTTDADAYASFLDRTGVADCRATSGNRGVMVMQRAAGEQTHFLFVSLWADEASIAGFAGPEPLRARFYPEDDGFLIARDEHVEHHTVVRDVR